MPEDPRRGGFRERSDVDEVQALLIERVSPLDQESVIAATAAGRVLAAAVHSTVDVPGFDRAAMDGFAVVAEDTFGASVYAPEDLEVTGQARPGSPTDSVLSRGQAVHVTTGAPVPAGADAVLPVEFTESNQGVPVPTTGDTVRIVGSVTPGKHISRRGEDVAQGSLVLMVGRQLRPQDLGVIASMGVENIAVVRRPTVDIIVTGDELLPPGSPPHGHRIVDASSPMLRALAQRDGAESTGVVRVGDDRDAIGEKLRASSADVVMITGGSSVGPEDHVPGVVRELGELPIHGIAMRPSSPAGIGFLGQRPVFLLPGNPASSLCAYEFFAGPTIRALGGRSRRWPHRRTTLPLADKINSQAGRTDYVRVRLDDGAVRPLMVSGAAILSSTTRSDGVVIVPQALEGIAAGEPVTVLLYD